jgi:hypothetical protein
VQRYSGQGDFSTAVDRDPSGTDSLGHAQRPASVRGPGVGHQTELAIALTETLRLDGDPFQQRVVLASVNQQSRAGHTNLHQVQEDPRNDPVHDVIQRGVLPPNSNTTPFMPGFGPFPTCLCTSRFIGAVDCRGALAAKTSKTHSVLGSSYVIQ